MPDPNTSSIAGFDNYLFDRYIHTLFRAFLGLASILLPILLPLNASSGKNEAGGVRGLDKLSFSNVGLSHSERYWAHLLLAVFVVILLSLTLRFELAEYRRLRQAFESDTLWLTHTVMITTSRGQVDVEAVRHHFGFAAGGIRLIEFNREYGDVYSIIQRRNALILRLEGAETELIKRANSTAAVSRLTEKDNLGWRRFLRSEQRPQMRLPVMVRNRAISIPLIGSKVDTINYCRSEIVRYNHVINRQRRAPLPSRSAFVTFNHQISGSLKSIIGHKTVPKSWSVTRPPVFEDIIWANLRSSTCERAVRRITVQVLATLLVLGISLPVSVSQVTYLASAVSSLAGINSLPAPLIALLQGVLLPALVVLFVSRIVPPSLRVIVQFRRDFSQQDMGKFIQRSYFTFLFIQIFIVSSASVSIPTVIAALKNRDRSVPAILAQVLPNASNYFFSHIIISTASTISGMIIQVTALWNIFFSPRTPRQKWEREESVFLKEWETFLPPFANIACIGMCDMGKHLLAFGLILLGIIYSVIAPLVLVFCTFSFGAFWILYRQYPPRLSRPELNPRGEFYPIAVRQLFTGIYVMEICLALLFFLVRDDRNRAVCLPHGSIMLVLVFATVLFQYLGCSNRNIRSPENKYLQVKPRAHSPSFQGPVIWLPRDRLGVAENEIFHARRYNKCLKMSCEGATLSTKGAIILHDYPFS